MIIRASERHDAKRCWARWWWGWREGLYPRRERYDARWFGAGVHIALAGWYCGPGLKRGPHPAEAWEEYAGEAYGYVKTSDATDDLVAKYEGMADLGQAMLVGYVDRYGTDDHMFVLQPEQTFSLAVPWPKEAFGVFAEHNAILAEHVGTYDLVWRDLRDDRVRLEEHKTAKAIELRHLALDDQGGTYWAVATATLRKLGLIGPRETLYGIQYNFLRKAEADDRPRDSEGYAVNKPVKADYVAALTEEYRANRDGAKKPWAEMTLAGLLSAAGTAGLQVLGERSKVQPPPLFLRHDVHRTSRERATMMRRIQAEALHMRAVRDGLLPITTNPTRDCGWDCTFYDMCELQERGGNWEDFRDRTFKVRDPYEDHRKSTEE
jgi:hypothetical protein